MPRAQITFVRFRRIAIFLLMLAACHGTDPFALQPFPMLSIQKAALGSGDGQTDSVLGTLAGPLRVLVLSNGAPAPGIEVSWNVQAGAGSLSPIRATTDSIGFASVSWTLGPSTGQQVAQAAVPGADGSPITFIASATLRPGLSIQLPATGSGDGQTDTVLATLASPLRLVALHDGAPAPGVAVTWLMWTGLRFDTVQAITDGAGMASLKLTLGPLAGSYLIEAFVPGASGSPVTWAATATSGNAVQLASLRGDSQMGLVGEALPDDYVVLARDAHGNPTAGVVVDWGVTRGGGAVSPAQSTTNAQGLAAARLTPGPSGAQGVTAVAHDPASGSAIFTAMGVDVLVRDGMGPSLWPEFSPSTVTVPSGGSVGWVVDRQACDPDFESVCEHSVTFEDAPSAPSSSPILQGTRITHVRRFTTPRTIRYRCIFHSVGFAPGDGEVGTVVVQ